VTSSTILKMAEKVAAVPVPALRGAWPRAGALLARQALETAIQDLWSRQAPAMAGVSMRAQLLCLADYLDDTTAEDVAYAWTALSDACHYHPYDLAPTGAELANLLSMVERLLPPLALP
jgi:hypothetical protein